MRIIAHSRLCEVNINWHSPGVSGKGGVAEIQIYANNWKWNLGSQALEPTFLKKIKNKQKTNNPIPKLKGQNLCLTPTRHMLFWTCFFNHFSFRYPLFSNVYNAGSGPWVASYVIIYFIYSTRHYCNYISKKSILKVKLAQDDHLPVHGKYIKMMRTNLCIDNFKWWCEFPFGQFQAMMWISFWWSLQSLGYLKQ